MGCGPPDSPLGIRSWPASAPRWVPGIAEGPGLPTWKLQVEPDGQGGQGAGPWVGVELP